MGQKLIAKDGHMSAYVDENGNYYFHHKKPDQIQRTTEEKVKKWCKETFHREDVFDHLEEVFSDDPDFEMVSLEFLVPMWMANEFFDFRDRNSLTHESAFYRLWGEEKERRRKQLEEFAKHPEDYEDEDD